MRAFCSTAAPSLRTHGGRRERWRLLQHGFLPVAHGELGGHALCQRGFGRLRLVKTCGVCLRWCWRHTWCKVTLCARYGKSRLLPLGFYLMPAWSLSDRTRGWPMIWTAARHLLASPVEVSPVDRPHGLGCSGPGSLATRTCDVGALLLCASS